MSKNIAVLITNLFEDVEFTSPAKALKEAGHTIVTIEKEAGKVVEGEKGKSKVTIDKSIDDVRAEDFDAL